MKASKDGKTSWKARKEAMEEIEASLKACNGSLDTNPQQMRQLIDMFRGLRDRLSDTQINLRPTAARVIGSILAAVNKPAQAKLGKVVFSALLNSALTDIKKPMRDACLESTRLGLTASALDGGEPNEQAIEAFVTVFSADVNEAAARVRKVSNNACATAYMLSFC